MEITEVRIKLMEDASERLQAFCSITFDDCFVVRDLKIIEGASGPFVAMPSRRLTSHCHQCGCKNHLRAGYCNQCGARLKEDRAPKDEEGRAKLYADIAHPINSTCREMIQERVIAAFQEEIDRSKLPGYVSSYDDFEEDVAPTRDVRRFDRKDPGQRPPASPPAQQSTAGQPQSEASSGGGPPAPHKAAPAPSSSRHANRSSGSSHGGFGAGIL